MSDPKLRTNLKKLSDGFDNTHDLPGELKLNLYPEAITGPELLHDENRSSCQLPESELIAYLVDDNYDKN